MIFLLGAKVKSVLVTPAEAVTPWFVTTLTLLHDTTITPRNVIITANCITKARLAKGILTNKTHSVWFVPTGMNGLPQNVLLNFRFEFSRSDLCIYHSSGISEIFCQIVSTPLNKIPKTLVSLRFGSHPAGIFVVSVTS